MALQRMNHVTILSNFARAYDKYSRSYDKASIAESTYPDRFFLLSDDDLPIGVEKATKLLRKTGLAGDKLLVLRTEIDTEDLQPNARTGVGSFISASRVRILDLRVIEAGGVCSPAIPEEVYAAALRILNPSLIPYDALSPRSLSVLPVARACQAACAFCFSEASASLDQTPHDVDFEAIERWCREARERGAHRFVITGGGEPALLAHDKLVRLLELGKVYFPTTVLITNGIHLARTEEAVRRSRLDDYATAGLSVLSISRHHHDPEVNKAIMGVDTRTELVLNTLKHAGLAPFRKRCICVLQKGGVENATELRGYLDWAARHDVGEICFKELYVSSTLESTYHLDPANTWALEHQVPLDLVTSFLQESGFTIRGRLPWGSPIFDGTWNGSPIRVAAYAEPSLYWERTNGIARSWNVMADASCLASLEDPQSHIYRAQPVCEMV